MVIFRYRIFWLVNFNSDKKSLISIFYNGNPVESYMHNDLPKLYIFSRKPVNRATARGECCGVYSISHGVYMTTFRIRIKICGNETLTQRKRSQNLFNQIQMGIPSLPIPPQQSSFNRILNLFIRMQHWVNYGALWLSRRIARHRSLVVQNTKS